MRENPLTFYKKKLFLQSAILVAQRLVSKALRTGLMKIYKLLFVIVDLWLCNGSSCLDIWVHIEGSEKPNQNVFYFFFYTFQLLFQGQRQFFKTLSNPIVVFLYLGKSYPFLFTRNKKWNRILLVIKTIPTNLAYKFKLFLDSSF